MIQSIEWCPRSVRYRTYQKGLDDHSQNLLTTLANMQEESVQWHFYLTVSAATFVKGKDKGIEMHRIVPNVTHLMQTLDEGVFGPLTTKWHITC